MSEIIWDHQEKPTYIAISEHGFGCHEIPAAAIRLAQDEVPAKSERSQLLVYATFDDIEPAGWDDGPVWPTEKIKVKGKGKGKTKIVEQPVGKVRLVGLTNTHQLYVQSYKGREHA